MKNVQYEIDGVVYSVSPLQAGVVEQLEGEARNRLIKRSAVSVRDKDEPEPEVEVKPSAATQGPVSTKKTGA